MNILVLGGTRFVGRAIVDRLAEGHDVTLLNRGTRPLPRDDVKLLVGTGRTGKALPQCCVIPMTSWLMSPAPNPPCSPAF